MSKAQKRLTNLLNGNDAYETPLKLQALLCVVDLSAITTAAVLAWFFRMGLSSGVSPIQYTLAVATLLVSFVTISISRRIYKRASLSSRLTFTYHAFVSVVLSFALLLLVAFAFKLTSNFSRIWGASWIIIVASYIIFLRPILFVRTLSKSSLLLKARELLIVANSGELEEMRNFLDHLNSNPAIRTRLIIADRDQLAAEEIKRLKKDNTFDKVAGAGSLEETLLVEALDDVLVLGSLNNTVTSQKLKSTLFSHPINVFFLPRELQQFPYLSFGSYFGTNVLQLQAKPITEVEAMLKRGFDVLAACMLLLITSPLLILTAIAIKLESKGSTLFVQPREGFNGSIINVFKFRSMFQEREDMDCSVQTTRNDPRVTRVGAIIRKTSIDELPQLFNVLKGEMSLVGPRPHAMGTKAKGRLFREVVDSYVTRHKMKPGVTGWAQVNGWRGETDTEEKIRKRVEFDIYYINNWSFRLDIKILLKTLYVVLLDTKNTF